jgi:hypothetical protein
MPSQMRGVEIRFSARKCDDAKKIKKMERFYIEFM